MKLHHLLFLLLFASNSFAQNQTSSDELVIDNRLYDIFDEEYLENLKDNNPFMIQRWNYYLDHAWYLSDYPSEKGNPDYPTIQINNLDQINIFQIEKEQLTKRDWNKQMMYQIEGTNKILVYHSGKKFVNLLNEHLGRTVRK